MITATRYHDFSAGHIVTGHENKCNYLHGHNYRIHFEVTPNFGLDSLGRVLDFSVINSKLCLWLEENWDHKMLIWEQDPRAEALKRIDSAVVLLKFIPTAEEMAQYLLETVGPEQLRECKCKLVQVTVEETRKCSATARIGVGHVV